MKNPTNTDKAAIVVDKMAATVGPETSIGSAKVCVGNFTEFK